MFNFLTSKIIYRYNDMSNYLIRGLSTYKDDFLFRGYTNNYFVKRIRIEMLTGSITNFIWKHTGPIAANNILIFVSVVLNIYFSYKLFKKIFETLDKGKHKGNTALQLVFSLTFALAPYYILRVVSVTSSLYFIFVFPQLLHLLIEKKNFILISLYTLFVFSISAYYGYFAFLIAIFWITSEFIYELLFNKNLDIKSLFKNGLIFCLPIILFFLVFYWDTVSSNIGTSSNYKNLSRIERIKTKTIYRTVEDFYNFSSRPWYFFIPPKTSLLFGNLSREMHNAIQSTGYYLADDYQEEEMAGNYFGWHFLIGTIFLLVMFLKKDSNWFEKNKAGHKLTFYLFASLALIILVTGPPSFSLSGINIYTPSYLLYIILPGFRALARLSSVAFVFVLALNLILLIKLGDSIFKGAKNFYLNASVLVFILSFLLLSIKIPVIDINDPPQEYIFLKSNSEEKSVFIVLPKPEYQHTFWVLYHQSYYYNPKDFVNPQNGFSSTEFTKKILENQDKLEELVNYDVDYVLVNKDANYEDLNKLLVNLEDAYGRSIYSDKNTSIFKIR